MKKRIAIICIGFLVAVTSVVLLCLSMQSSKPSHWVIQEMKTKLQADYIEYVSEEYRRELGVHPPLDNKKLVMALLGDNKSKREFAYRSSLNLNQNNEIVDPWGNVMAFMEVDGKVKAKLAPK